MTRRIDRKIDEPFALYQGDEVAAPSTIEQRIADVMSDLDRPCVGRAEELSFLAGRAMPEATRQPLERGVGRKEVNRERYGANPEAVGKFQNDAREVDAGTEPQVLLGRELSVLET